MQSVGTFYTILSPFEQFHQLTSDLFKRDHDLEQSIKQIFHRYLKASPQELSFTRVRAGEGDMYQQEVRCSAQAIPTLVGMERIGAENAEERFVAQRKGLTDLELRIDLSGERGIITVLKSKETMRGEEDRRECLFEVGSEQSPSVLFARKFQLLLHANSILNLWSHLKEDGSRFNSQAPNHLKRRASQLQKEQAPGSSPKLVDYFYLNLVEQLFCLHLSTANSRSATSIRAFSNSARERLESVFALEALVGDLLQHCPIALLPKLFTSVPQPYLREDAGKIFFDRFRSHEIPAVVGLIDMKLLSSQIPFALEAIKKCHPALMKPLFDAFCIGLKTENCLLQEMVTRANDQACSALMWTIVNMLDLDRLPPLMPLLTRGLEKCPSSILHEIAQRIPTDYRDSDFNLTLFENCDVSNFEAILRPFDEEELELHPEYALALLENLHDRKGQGPLLKIFAALPRHWKEDPEIYQEAKRCLGEECSVGDGGPPLQSQLEQLEQLQTGTIVIKEEGF